MYAAPHEVAVNIPAVLSGVRDETYREYGWPRVLARLFGGGLRSAVAATALGVIAAVGAVFAFGAPGALLTAQTGEGSFFRILPYAAMVLPFIALTLYVVAVMAGGLV